MSLNPADEGDNPLESVKIYDKDFNLVHDFSQTQPQPQKEDYSDEDDEDEDYEDYDEDYDDEDYYEYDEDYEDEEDVVSTGEGYQPPLTPESTGVSVMHEKGDKEDEDWVNDPKFWDELEKAIIEDNKK